ncbi:MAG: hypothetical protein NC421_08770 [Lachnospiraceae bacterium]|nr:hypothetical protein [Lachnospiraceae bacterium]
MNLKKWTIDSVSHRFVALFFAVVFLSASKVCPQEAVVDSVTCHVDLTEQAEPVSESKYEQRLRRHQSWVQKMIPDILVFQYAGGIGTYNLGVGWDYGKHDRWETHFLVGFIPSRYNLNHYWTTTLRECYVPWRVDVNPYIRMQPLVVQLSINSILHGDFWASEPDRYPHGYYSFSSRVRFHLGLGQRFTYKIPQEKRYLSREVSLYYEVSTCDLYVRQKIRNRSIPLRDIVILSVGAIWKI